MTASKKTLGKFPTPNHVRFLRFQGSWHLARALGSGLWALRYPRHPTNLFPAPPRHMHSPRNTSLIAFFDNSHGPSRTCPPAQLVAAIVPGRG